MAAPGASDGDAPRESGASGAVFVDHEGRRSRWVALAGRGVAGVCVLYVGLVVASLLGAPWVPREVLPSVGPTAAPSAPAMTLPPTATRQATPVLSPPSTTVLRPAPSTVAPLQSGSVPTTTSLPGRRLGTSTTTSPSATSTTGAPTTTTTAPGRGSTAPGRIRRG